MVIRQGDVYWMERKDIVGSEIAKRRPYVIIQNDILNETRIQTTIVCVITSSQSHAKARGTVALEQGEANLSRPSIVNVSQVLTVDRSRLESKIGALSPQRVREIVDGLILMIEPKRVIERDESNAYGSD